ncbi:hypothetical protein L1987_20008 [Smallanthus sonchifolius]|uniref:Uncharacterized protein n=1 Tax=Smallanthus sonchifolius TaxID=185202 RepID=A0ACB9IRF2_9ASTR|nr:hypothetical protein L1987_20008 [Smallanthus sonchifolius]
MTGLKDLLSDLRFIDGGYVAFAGDEKGVAIPQASSSTSAVQEDYSVDFLPISTRLIPRLPDLVILAQDEPAPSQYDVTASIQNNVYEEAPIDQVVSENTTVVSSDQELNVDANATASPLTR